MSKSAVVSIVALHGRSESMLLTFAAGAAGGLGAAVAAAILDTLDKREVAIGSSDCPASPEQTGVVASIRGHSVVVGNGALFTQLGLCVDQFGDWPDRLQKRGERVLFVAVDGRTAGLLGVTTTT